MKLLLVEDSERLRYSVSRSLIRLGHAVDCAGAGEDGDRLVRENEYDIVILDLMLPGRGGLEFLEEWRREGIDTPVIVLTALGAVENRVNGLALGADDYLTKPFAVEELVARLEAVGRRTRGMSGSVVKLGDLEIDLAARRVLVSGKPITLTAREFSLLECLARHPGRIFSREEIEDRLYGESNSPLSNAVDVAVFALRRKLGEGRDSQLIQTRRGLGYVIEIP